MAYKDQSRFLLSGVLLVANRVCECSVQLTVLIARHAIRVWPARQTGLGTWPRLRSAAGWTDDDGP